MPRTPHLDAILMGVGHHEAAWRHPRHRLQAALFRTEHTCRTLREHDGLSRPVSAYAASTLVSA
ncbi:hypothetical protein AB0B85_31515 [Micromonospora sp. NPDC049044]|uniref:hypothetical protein n=1 Tax=unclassified Micromonospora TaxID=2617518 RepID=UPI0033C94B42